MKTTKTITEVFDDFDGTPADQSVRFAFNGATYEIDLTRPVGHRIRNLSHPDGSPVRDDERFAVALNHYRRSGAGDYPDVSTAPVLYNDMVEIRQLLIDWALERGVAVPGTENWRIVTK